MGIDRIELAIQSLATASASINAEREDGAPPDSDTFLAIATVEALIAIAEELRRRDCAEQ